MSVDDLANEIRRALSSVDGVRAVVMREIGQVDEQIDLWRRLLHTSAASESDQILGGLGRARESFIRVVESDQGRAKRHTVAW
jgi:hypothetical protein